MKPFMDKDFLLDTPTARHLYHDYCEALPICDYHCHLSPKEIYENAITAAKAFCSSREFLNSNMAVLLIKIKNYFAVFKL